MAAYNISTFHWLDYVIFVGMLLISVGIGVLFAIRDKRAKAVEYLAGNHDAPLYPVVISIVVSFMSAISVIGCAAEVYTAGYQYIWNAAGLGLSVVLTTVIFLPVIYPLKLTSGYQVRLIMSMV